MTDPPSEDPPAADSAPPAEASILPGTWGAYRLVQPGAPVERVVRRQRKAAFAEETIRALLALLALALVITTVVLGWMSTTGSHWASAKDWLGAVLPAETGILGSALGFYFGTKQHRDD